MNYEGPSTRSGTTMSFPPGSTAFFDIWTTLAFVELSADGEHLATFTVYPHVIKILRELAGEGVRLGVLSDRGRIPEDEMRYALRTSGLAPLYDQMVVVFGRTTAPGTFTRTTARIREVEGCGGARLVYVSNELPATTNAGRFGFLTAPDPRLALSRLQEGGRLRYLRIGAPARLEKHWPAVLCNQPLAPVHIMAGDSDDEPSAIIAVADERTADALESEGFQVQRLGFPDEPQTNGLYSLQGGLKP